MDYYYGNPYESLMNDYFCLEKRCKDLEKEKQELEKKVGELEKENLELRKLICEIIISRSRENRRI